jgi:agmatine deiminase
VNPTQRFHGEDLNSTHGDNAFRWPAEWEPKDALILTWPENRETWPGERLKRTEDVYVELLIAMASRERVICLVSSQSMREYAEQKVHQSRAPGQTLTLEWLVLPSNDLWIRDYGPIGVWKENEPVWLNWTYNAWGGKYPPFDLDNAIPEALAE